MSEASGSNGLRKRIFSTYATGGSPFVIGFRDPVMVIRLGNMRFTVTVESMYQSLENCS